MNIYSVLVFFIGFALIGAGIYLAGDAFQKYIAPYTPCPGNTGPLPDDLSGCIDGDGVNVTNAVAQARLKAAKALEPFLGISKFDWYLILIGVMICLVGFVLSWL